MNPRIVTGNISLALNAAISKINETNISTQNPNVTTNIFGFSPVNETGSTKYKAKTISIKLPEINRMCLGLTYSLSENTTVE